MIQINITLGYVLIHLLSVIYIFNMFKAQDYVADEFDKCIVWLFAPFIVIITFIRAVGGIK